jgi:hypothetical protein
MKMQFVEFIGSETINCTKNIFYRKPMSRDIEIKASMSHLGGILDIDRSKLCVDCPSVRVSKEELDEGLESVQAAIARGGSNGDFAFFVQGQFIAFILFK